jgi:ferredoxin
MPSNWISIHPALTEKAVKYIHRKNYNLVEKHAHIILSGKKDFLALRDIIQDILISPISLGYYLLGRYVFAKSFYASYKCDNCGSCIKQCPVKAIVTLKDRPFWTFKCESCMKCMNSCPKSAIETAHGLFVLVSLILSSISSLLLISILPQNGVNDLVRFVVLNLLFVFLLWILYRVQHFLLGKKIISRIISFTSLTYYKIWGRYRSKTEYLSNSKTL